MSVRKLSPELQIKAVEELNEDVTKINDQLEDIRQWIAEQPGLLARTDDQWLLGFLRGCKYDMDKVKDKIKKFYISKSTIPELYRDRNPLSPEMQYILKSGLYVPLNTSKYPQMPTILFVRLKSYDHKNMEFVDLMKTGIAILDLMIRDNDDTVINGLNVVIDMEGFTFGHITKISLHYVYKALITYQESYPLRPKGLTFFNLQYIGVILNMIKYFLKPKLKKRIFVHKSVETLYQQIPKAVLLNEYGGEAGPIQNLIDEWRIKLEDNVNWYIEDSRYGCENM